MQDVDTKRFDAFLQTLRKLPHGSSKGSYQGKSYGVNFSVEGEGRRMKLFGEELGGTDFVSFNLYIGSGGKPLLKPCEMPAQKVIDFVLGYKPEPE